MSTRRDWAAWHDAYDDPDSAADAHRLLAVQARIAAALDQAPGRASCARSASARARAAT